MADEKRERGFDEVGCAGQDKKEIPPSNQVHTKSRAKHSLGVGTCLPLHGVLFGTKTQALQNCNVLHLYALTGRRYACPLNLH